MWNPLKLFTPSVPRLREPSVVALAEGAPNVSRRLFLIGSAAALAATQLPAGPGRPVTAAISDRFRYREVNEILIGGTKPPPAADVAVRNTFGLVGDDEAIFDVSLNARGCYRWRAIEGAELIVPHDRVMRLTCDPGLDGWRMCLVSNMESDRSKKPRYFEETFEFADGRLDQVGGPLCLDTADFGWPAEVA